jgi:parallel beta-helix repeat protein
MPEEYINVTLSLVDGKLFAKVNGTYPFKNVDYTLVRMDYPVPPDATSISVRMNETSLYWTHNAKNYPTVIGNWPMINWTISPIPENFTIQTYYEHPVPVIGENRTFLYAMGTGRYLETYAKETSAYVRIRMETRYTDLHVYTVGNASGTWTWKPAEYAIVQEDTTDIIVLNVTSQLFAPLKEDLLVTFTPATATVSISPATREVNVGERFNVTVNVANVIGFHDLQFRLAWNTTVLRISDAFEGEFLKTGGQTFFLEEPFQEEGYMYVGCTLLGNLTGVSGNGTFASLEFLALAPGETLLDISESPYEEADGRVLVHGIAPAREEGLLVEPPKIDLRPRPTQDPVWRVPFDFPTIQTAINSPSVNDGDKLHVFAGTYTENVLVWKSLTIFGQDRATTLITAANPFAPTIRVEAQNVQIMEFSISGGSAGILTGSAASRTRIYNNFVTRAPLAGNVVGIVSFHSSDHEVVNNEIADNAGGILLWNSGSDRIRANNVTRNSAVGIQIMLGLGGNTIYWNNFTQPAGVPNAFVSPAVANTWDNAAMQKGNYWSVNVPGQGPYMNPANVDNFPLASPWIPIIGDVNFDGVVNILDISIIAQAFGTRFSDQRWNPLADVNRDGQVNILDIARAAMNFGQRDP